MADAMRMHEATVHLCREFDNISEWAMGRKPKMAGPEVKYRGKEVGMVKGPDNHDP